MSERIGRWVLDDTSTRYGVAGWHLDDGPIVLDWMPSCDEGCEPGTRGDEHYDCCWSLYGWPGRADADPVDRYLTAAMSRIEREWAHHNLACAPGAGRNENPMDKERTPAGEAGLTREQQQMLAELRAAAGPLKYRRQARRTAAVLADRGLADVTGTPAELVEALTLTARPAATAGLCVIDGTPIGRDRRHPDRPGRAVRSRLPPRHPAPAHRRRVARLVGHGRRDARGTGRARRRRPAPARRERRPAGSRPDRPVRGAAVPIADPRRLGWPDPPGGLLRRRARRHRRRCRGAPRPDRGRVRRRGPRRTAGGDVNHIDRNSARLLMADLGRPMEGRLVETTARKCAAGDPGCTPGGRCLTCAAIDSEVTGVAVLEVTETITRKVRVPLGVLQEAWRRDHPGQEPPAGEFDCAGAQAFTSFDGLVGELIDVADDAAASGYHHQAWGLDPAAPAEWAVTVKVRQIDRPGMRDFAREFAAFTGFHRRWLYELARAGVTRRAHRHHCPPEAAT